MSEGGEVTAAFQYIDMVFNVSGPVSGDQSEKTLKEKDLGIRANQACKVGCGIDGVKAVGFPEVAFQSKASGIGVDSASERYLISILVTVAVFMLAL
jgi:hypothetical protein